MLSALTLADATGVDIPLISTPKREVGNVTGLYGVAPLRDTKRVRPNTHGAINETKFQDGKPIVIEGQVSSTVSKTDAWNEWRLLVAPMLDTLDFGPALLKWTEAGSALALQRLVKLDSDVDPPLHDEAVIFDYQAQFFAEDPRAYSQNLTTATGAVLATQGGGHVFPATYPRFYSSSGGGTVNFTNNGNRPTPPIFRIYGQCVNPQIVNLGTGVRIAIIGTVNAGDYLELDASKRTVKLNGTINRQNFYDAANSTWADMAKGTSNYQMVAASFDGVARLDVLGRDAYA